MIKWNKHNVWYSNKNNRLYIRYYNVYGGFDLQTEPHDPPRVYGWNCVEKGTWKKVERMWDLVLVGTL